MVTRACLHRDAPDRQLLEKALTILLELGTVDASGRLAQAPRLLGWFLEGRFQPYTRVDATAHCVSAMVKLAS